MPESWSVCVCAETILRPASASRSEARPRNMPGLVKVAEHLSREGLSEASWRSLAFEQTARARPQGGSHRSDGSHPRARAAWAKNSSHAVCSRKAPGRLLPLSSSIARRFPRRGLNCSALPDAQACLSSPREGLSCSTKSRSSLLPRRQHCFSPAKTRTGTGERQATALHRRPHHCHDQPAA